MSVIGQHQAIPDGFWNERRPVYEWLWVSNPSRRWFTPWRPKTAMTRGKQIGFESPREGIVRFLNARNEFVDWLSARPDSTRF